MNALLKFLYRLYRASSWLKYTATRRFTPQGLGVLGALGLCTLMVPDTDNNLSYQAFAFLLCLVLVPVAFCFYFKGRFEIERVLPRFATAGSKLSYAVHVRNLTRKPQTALALLENLRDPRPSFREWSAVQLADERRIKSFRFTNRRRSKAFTVAKVRGGSIPPLGPGESAEAHVEVLPLKRGVLRFEGLTLARPDPLGMVRAFHKQPLSQTMLILPRRYPLPLIALPGSMKYQQGGVALAANIGQSEEFVSLRDYRNGDPLRHIHWRSWAKAGKPVVKEFEDEFFVRHALILDTFTDHPHSEAFEEAVSVAASFACTIATQESLLDLLFVGAESYCFTAGRGLGGEDQMLEVLAGVMPRTHEGFEALERLVLNHVRLVSGCICVLLTWDKTRENLVRELEALGVPALIFIVVESGAGEKTAQQLRAAGRADIYVLEAGRIQEGLAKVK